MSKIYSFPFKKGLISFVALFSLVLVGLGIAKAADLQLPTAEGTQIILTWDNDNKYYFTAQSDGVLSISLNKMLTYRSYLLFEENGTGVPFATKVVDEWTPVEHILSATWNLTAGKRYYFTNTAGDDGVVCKFSWSGEGGGTIDPGPGVDPDPDPDPEPIPGGFETPAGYEAMPTVKGPLSNPQQANATQISANGNFYYFEAPSEGKLVIWQWGSSRFDGHLWKIPFANDNWEPWGSQVEDTGSPLDSPTPNYITYPLSAGQQVYWYAKSGQGITYAIFAWEGTNVATIPTIGLDTPTTVASKALYAFTATESGVLNADLSSPAGSSENVGFSTGLAALPAEQHFFYANSGHSQEVQALATSGGANGWHVSFEVEKGVTYYVFNPTLNSVVFTFSMDPNGAVNPKLEAVQPLPGGIDNDAQESTITVQFYPAAVSIASVDFVYTDLQGQLQTITNVQCDFLNGAYNVPRAQHMNMDGTKLHEAYDNPNATVYYQISKAEGSVQRYILHQVNYNGKPLADSDIKAGVDIAADGTLTLNYAVDTPPTLVSQVVPDPFYHQWTAGDPAGVMILTYNKDLNPAYTPEVNIIEGTQYYGSEPGENDQTWAVNPSHIKVEGKTLTVDFTGSDAILTAEESVDGVPVSIPWGPGRSNITLYVGGVMGANNLPAAYSGDPAFMPHVTYVSSDAPAPAPQSPALVSVVPSNNGELTVNQDGTATFVLNFNQEVKVINAGQVSRWGTGYDYNYATTPSTGSLAKSWSISFPADMVEQIQHSIDDDFTPMLTADIRVEAKDGGEVEYGNLAFEGDGYLSTFRVMFTVEPLGAGYDFTTSLENGANEAPVRSFTVSAEGAMSANMSDVADNDGNVINPFKSITVTGPNGFVANAETFDDGTQSVGLDKAITDPGTYTISFPLGAFNISFAATGLNERIEASAEREFTFEVVLGEDVFDSQIDGITLSAVPPHGDNPDNAASVAQENMDNVTLSWGGRELELTGEGGLTVSGPNGYFADFGTDAHNFSIVDGNSIVIDMASIYAEIADEIAGLAGVVDASYYNGVYKFTLGRKTVRINGNGARAIDAADVVYNDEANLYYNISFTVDDTKYDLELDNKEWYPVANRKYYFAPASEGVLKWTVYENGEVTQTQVVGGLYIVNFDGTADLLVPEATDEFEDIFGPVCSYASYTLQPDEEYYFMWTKNDGYNDYALHVTWDGETNGILNILEAVDGLFRVYNLQGVNVLNTENALDINSLQPGIYIVNGKKVMIRK